MRGAVYFIGAGPGAADLITLRGASRIAEADLVLYTPSVIDAGWLRLHTKDTAELVDHGRLAGDELVELYRKLASRHQRAVRLFAGDSAQSPEAREHRELCEKLGLDVEIVPGIAPASAAAAATGNALIEAGVAETAVYTEADFARVRDLVTRCATVVVQAPAARAADLAEVLVGNGIDPAMPVAVAYKVTWPDQILVRTTLGELAAEVKRHNLWRTTLFLIGDALREAKPRAGYGRVTESDMPPAPRWAARSWKSSREPSTWAARTAEAKVRTCVEPDDQPEPPAVLNGSAATNGSAVALVNGTSLRSVTEAPAEPTIEAPVEPKVNGAAAPQPRLNGAEAQAEPKANGVAEKVNGAEKPSSNGVQSAAASKPRSAPAKAAAKSTAKKAAPAARASGRRATKKS
jgi:precorrin-4/cobalt-precorrin-4 C11-methyltransferase